MTLIANVANFWPTHTNHTPTKKWEWHGEWGVGVAHSCLWFPWLILKRSLKFCRGPEFPRFPISPFPHLPASPIISMQMPVVCRGPALNNQYNPIPCWKKPRALFVCCWGSRHIRGELHRKLDGSRDIKKISNHSQKQRQLLLVANN